MYKEYIIIEHLTEIHKYRMSYPQFHFIEKISFSELLLISSFSQVPIES